MKSIFGGVNKFGKGAAPDSHSYVLGTSTVARTRIFSQLE